MSKFCNQLIITNKYMKNLALILSIAIVAVTSILTVPSVFLLNTTESLRNNLLKESQLQWLEDDIHKRPKPHVPVNSRLFCTHLVVAHCLCHQCHSKVKRFLKPHRVRTLRLDLCLLSLTIINTSCKFVVKVLHIYNVYIWCSYPNWQIRQYWTTFLFIKKLQSSFKRYVTTLSNWRMRK